MHSHLHTGMMLVLALLPCLAALLRAAVVQPDQVVAEAFVQTDGFVPHAKTEVDCPKRTPLPEATEPSVYFRRHAVPRR